MLERRKKWRSYIEATRLLQLDGEELSANSLVQLMEVQKTATYIQRQGKNGTQPRPLLSAMSVQKH